MKEWNEFLRSLVHPGPITTLVLIKTITLSTIYCSLMWWPPERSVGGLLSLTIFLISSGMVMFNFFSAINNGPGYLPLGWEPKDKEGKGKLQFCLVCKGYKAPRAHHCRKCGRCVLKLDHHCPWINNCVGHYNHAHFVFFLIFAVLGCTHSFVVLSCSLYRAMYRTYYMYYGISDVPYVYLGVYGFVWCLLSCGCAVGVSLGVAVLLYYQMKVVVRNETTIEEWIMEKAAYRRKVYSNLQEFKNPYNLGWRKNFDFVMNWACTPRGSGFDFPLVEGSDPYAMTVEQIQQKNDKKRRARECTVIKEYSGSWFPISKGCCVFLHPPCSDEPRIRVKEADVLLVTRWKKYWIYGELYNNNNGGDGGITEVSLPRKKGWLPRLCAIEVMNSSFFKNEVEEEEEEEEIEERHDREQDTQTEQITDKKND